MFFVLDLDKWIIEKKDFCKGGTIISEYRFTLLFKEWTWLLFIWLVVITSLAFQIVLLMATKKSDQSTL